MSYFVQLGVAFDMMLNAILGGEAGQTLSYRAALAASQKVWGWCVFCRFLSWWVQRNHCANQLAGIGMDGDQYARAFVGLLMLAALLAAPVFFVWRHAL